MKIAMVMDAWDPILGGGQVHVKNLAERLVLDHGCQVDLFVRSLRGETGENFDSDETFFWGKFRVFRCGRPRPFFQFSERIFSIFSMVRRIVSEHRKSPYDAIHAHAFLGLLSGKIASLLLRRPVVATVHGANLLDKGDKTLFYWVEKWLLTQIRYDAQITVGSSFLRYPNANLPVVIPNGVNVEEFDRVENCPDDRFGILFVGRFEWTKGLDVLIDAVKILRDNDEALLRRLKIEFRLVGYGYSEAEYRQKIAYGGLDEYFRFLGRMEGEKLIAEYKKARIFVLPSRTEGFWMTIIEAMAANVPVIATKCGWPEDIVRNGENGILVEKENPVQLAEAISGLVSEVSASSPKIGAMIAAAKTDVNQKYSWKRVGEMTMGAYRLVVKANPETDSLS